MYLLLSAWDKNQEIFTETYIWRFYCSGLRFLVSARVASDPRVGIFSVLIAAEVAGSIVILPRCVLNDCFPEGYERSPDLWGLS